MSTLSYTRVKIIYIYIKNNIKSFVFNLKLRIGEENKFYKFLNVFNIGKFLCSDFGCFFSGRRTNQLCNGSMQGAVQTNRGLLLWLRTSIAWTIRRRTPFSNPM